MQENNNPKTKSTTIIIVVIAASVVAAAAYFFLSKKGTATANTIQTKDSLLAKKDTLQKGDEVPENDGEDDPYGMYYVLQDANAGGHQFHFGDKVFKDYGKSFDKKDAVVYLSLPDAGKPVTQTAYFINQDLLADEGDIEKYKKNFGLPPFNVLDFKTKKLILDNMYSDGTDYSITQNAERAKNTVCYGDFDDDGIADAAVILDNNEKQKSRLLVICTNAATQAKYLAYADNYSDKVKINSFKKGASILTNEAQEAGLVAAPIDGIMLTGENLKIAILYDKDFQKFKTWYQE